MRFGIKPIGKQINNACPAKYIWRETDGMDDNQTNIFPRGPLISIRRRYPACDGQPSHFIIVAGQWPHAFIPSRAMRYRRDLNVTPSKRAAAVRL